MATKKAKKRKTKKAVKKAVKKTVKKAAGKAVKKKAVKKPVRKKAARKPTKKPAPRPAARKPKSAPRPPTSAPAMKPPVAAPLPGEQRIGAVTHYYSHLSVAIIKLDQGDLRVGDTIHVRGHTSDFRQRIESMEFEHQKIPVARAGQEFGVRVIEHAREHDVVYKVAG